MAKKQTLPNRLVWIDLEMTGLNPERDVILEIATIITDNNLELIAQGPSIVVHQTDELLQTMDEWCTKTHTESGLYKAVQESIYSLEQAEQMTVDFLQEHGCGQAAVLCGNSIWQDRIFITRYMPKLLDCFHYKMIDVSSLQELIKRWYGKDKRIEFKKKDAHRALSDIQESIEELKHYKNMFFVPIE